MVVAARDTDEETQLAEASKAEYAQPHRADQPPDAAARDPGSSERTSGGQVDRNDHAVISQVAQWRASHAIHVELLVVANDRPTVTDGQEERAPRGQRLYTSIHYSPRLEYQLIPRELRPPAESRVVALGVTYAEAAELLEQRAPKTEVGTRSRR